MITRRRKEEIIKIFEQEKIYGLSIGDRGVLWDILLEKYGEPVEFSSFGAIFEIKNSKSETVKVWIDGNPDLGDYIRAISTIGSKIDLNDFLDIDKILEEFNKILEKSTEKDILDQIKEMEDKFLLREQARIRASEMIEETYQNDLQELERNLAEIGVDLEHVEEINSHIS